MFPNQNRLEMNQVIETFSNEDQVDDNRATWFNNGFQRRYACDRCRGHKLRCNRDLMASSSKPCQRCIKAKAKCVISSSFRPGKLGTQKEQQSKRSLVGDDAAEQSTRKRKSSGIPVEVERRTSPRNDNSIESLNPPTVATELQNGSPKRNHAGSTQLASSHQSNSENALPGYQEGHAGPGGDTLHLFSVPWMDIMNMQSFEETPELQYGSTLGEAAQVPDYDFSASARLSNYSFPSPSEAYGIGQASQPISVENMGIRNDTMSSSNTNHTRADDFGSLGSSAGPVQLDFLTDLGTNLDSISTHLASSVSEKSSSSTPANRKEASVQKLSELSANLMKDLNRLITCKLASSFLFTPSDDKTTVGYLFRTVDGSMSQNNAVGRLLQGTERFLEILEEYKQPLRVASPTEDPLEPVKFPQSGEFATPQQRMESRWSLVETYLGRAKAPGLITPESTESEVSGHSSSSQSLAMDVPSMLIVLNCYICLLKIFETVFITIQHSLQVSPTSPLYTKLPPTVPGFQISGFQLKNYRSLQIKILIQVSRHMLDSMEKSLGFKDEKGEIGGMFGDPVFQALLQTLLKQDGLHMSEGISGGIDTGMNKVRDLLTVVESELK